MEPAQEHENRSPWIQLEAIPLYENPYRLCPNNQGAQRAIAAYLNTRRMRETRSRIAKLLLDDPWMDQQEIERRLYVKAENEVNGRRSEWGTWWLRLGWLQQSGWAERALRAEVAYNPIVSDLREGKLISWRTDPVPA